ncbi:hypothetical protein HY480_02150 [Candidatus Uhrbacteria bacterium]|nr:hypothetical protein [Candidatus Uhrbacteria bacterium]
MRQNGSVQGNQHPSIAARNLLAVLIAYTGHALFGAKNVLDAQQLTGDVVVPNGNVPTFFRERAERFGVTGITTSAPKFDDAVLEVAKQLAQKCKYQGELKAEKVERIAIEYVLTACVTPIGAIEPFAQYLATAVAYRTAIKALNRARGTTTTDAFTKGDVATITKLNEDAKMAWQTIAGILTASPFFARLRTQVDVPLLFQTMNVWRGLQTIESEERGAVLTAIEGIARQVRNPIATEEMVQAARASVRGNLLLSVGNPYGVDAKTAITTIGANKATGVQANGGTKVTFTRTSPQHVLSALGGLHASLSGTITADGSKKLRVELDANEGEAGTGVVIPWMTPNPTTRSHAAFSA